MNLTRRIFAFLLDAWIVSMFMNYLLDFWLRHYAGTNVEKVMAAYEKRDSLPLDALVNLMGIFMSMLLISLVIFHGYFIVCEFRWGKTLGKRLFGLRLVTELGLKPTLRQCILREMMREIDCLLVFPGIISVLLSPSGQRLGDRLAKTQVVG